MILLDYFESLLKNFTFNSMCYCCFFVIMTENCLNARPTQFFSVQESKIKQLLSRKMAYSHTLPFNNPICSKTIM